jgi:predicted dehydrogenase/threonine dehydrogenase-like Zn-dependent dehydrogenase
MRQVLFKKGKVVIEEVPAPSNGANTLLIENLYSLISSGTEMSSLNFSKQPLPLKVLKYPTKLAKGLRLIKEHGIFKTYKIVTGMLEAGVTPGYSSCGRVIKVGANIKDIKEGDLVACAGANLASHAEIVSVPRNLVVKIPEGVVLEEAVSATLGSIALQGIRQADLRIGESAVVIGLGLVGQITIQILLANGIKVIGIEISKARIKKAQENGLKFAFSPTKKNLVNEVNHLTNFQGADATLITASGPENNTIVNQAMELTRKRGKVVVVGDVGLKIERLPWYEKEIDLRISSSYGPGRGDEEYENKGIDYPYAYVRWTENRNLDAYLKLLQVKKVNFLSLVEGKYQLEQANLAYKLLNSKKRPLAVILVYPSLSLEEKTLTSLELPQLQKIEGRIEVGIIGVGSFAQVIHLPNLSRLKHYYHLRGVCTNDPVKAKYFAQRYRANIATTDYNVLLNDPKINLIIITTRHHLHSRMVIDALRAGKNVFVEKPLCLTGEELEEIKEVVKNPTIGYSPMLFVGFNRRFSPFIEKIKTEIKERHSPLVINYRVNDNYLPPSHWTNTSEGGGRILGNACHMFDLFCYLTNSSASQITAVTINPLDTFYLVTDNFIASLRFKDGSIANLIYTTEGSEKFSKEYLELYSEGSTLILDDFKKLSAYGLKTGMKTMNSQKGHLEELEELAKAMHQRKWLIPWEEIEEATRISLEVDKQVRQVYNK